jgi:PAS domain-containing protein
MDSDRSKTRAQLIEDLTEARRKIAGLEGLLAEKNHTEEALKEAEQRYRAPFEQAADHILVFDPKALKPVAFNQRVCDDMGYTREEILSMIIADLEAKDPAEEIALRTKNIIR